MEAPQKYLATFTWTSKKPPFEVIKTTEEWLDVIPKGLCYDTISYLDRKISAIKLTSKSLQTKGNSE